MRPRLAVLAALLLSAAPAAANQVTLNHALVQGGLVQARVTPPNSVVTIDERQVRVSPDGVFLVGVGRDATRAHLVVSYPDGKTEARDLPVQKRSFAIQRIDGLPEKMVTPPPEVEARIEAEGRMVKEIRKRDDAREDYRAPFRWPVTGPISGVYGSQRILNGQPRAPHYGVDIAAPTGTPIKAPADGIVTMAVDLYFTGWTVILDHGHGLSSVFMHMSEIVAREGQRLKQGEMLGRLGATGRVTGPHLHWGLNLFETRLDPQLLVPPMPKGE